MASHRIDRTTEDIKRELTAILRELKDPRVQETMLSSMEGMDHAKRAVEGLKSAAGFIRRELGARIHIRHVPSLQFQATDSIEYSANIAKLLNDLK